MTYYDYVIAGGGAAGLGLAYQMAQSQLRGASVLIVDRDAKDRNDRTWCFWTNKPTPFDHLASHYWEQAEVVGEDYQQTFDLRPYQYKMIRGIDFYEGVRGALSDVEGVVFRKARVEGISDTKDKYAAQVMVDREPIGARYAFDSIIKPADIASGPRGYHYLKQHFKGWEIETPVDTFDPSTVTLFDFRTPQKGSMRFFYILPFSRRRAMVEYTIFSADVLKGNQYDVAIADYLEKVRGIPKYRIDAVESGVIPMTDMPFPRRLGARVMAIGTKGGLVKPSTGYAFLRMQNDGRHIVSSLINYGDPFHIPQSPGRYRLFDTIMLQVMHRNGSMMSNIFVQLFKNNPIQRIFKFLDEEEPFSEDVRLLTSLPIGPFLKALFRVKLLRKI